MKSMNWFLGCFPPFFSLVYAGAEFPVEGAAFDFWNTTRAQCSGSEVWKPLQANPHEIMLMFSGWREWEGKPDWCAVCEGWQCLHWSSLQQRKGGPWHSCSNCWRGDGGRGQAQFQCRNLALAKSLKWIALAFFPLNFCSLKQSFAFMRNKKLLQT